MMKTLFEQLGEVQRSALAGLIGAEDCAPFRNHLREMTALEDGFSLGDAARAYLKSRIEYLDRVRA